MGLHFLNPRKGVGRSIFSYPREWVSLVYDRNWQIFDTIDNRGELLPVPNDKTFLRHG